MGSAWFSAKLRYAVLIDGLGLQFYMDSVQLFRVADDYGDAFHRALHVGGKNERTYANGDGQQVAWKLASIISLDRIGKTLSDSREICSEPAGVPKGQTVPFTHEFHPENSRPTQTI